MTFVWTERHVRKALDLAPPPDPSGGPEYPRISTDSRALQPGDLFVALRGERFDGHDFVSDVLARGAGGAVVAQDAGIQELPGLFRVPDTLEALGRLAHYRRRALRARVVGITGSSGKTGTKELMKEAVAGRLRVHATPGNLNNRIGLPLTLLEAPPDAQALILEMGTNEPGEVGILTGIAEPEIGVVTTVSETHLEKLGSLEGVLEEKLDLLRGLPEDGLAVVGDEPPVLEKKARALGRTLLVTGWSERVRPEYRPEDPTTSEDGCFRFRWRGEPVALRVPGRHGVQNALLALTVADVLGVPAREAAERVGFVVPGAMRSEIRSVGSLTLLVDCYNANPQSLRAALDLLAGMGTPGRRVAVLGSMLELGRESKDLHRRSLQDALGYPLDLIVATGLFADAASEVDLPASGPRLLTASELEEATELLLESLEGSEILLLKASRGVALERLIPSLEGRFGPGGED